MKFDVVNSKLKQGGVGFFRGAAWFAFLCLTVLTPSQSSYAFDLSALGGLTLSNFSQSLPLANSSSMGTGYGLAALVDFGMLPMWSLESGLFFTQNNVSLSNVYGTQASGSISINNLSLPLMVRFRPFSFIAVEAGGYVGLAATGNMTVVNSGQSSSSSVTPNTDNGLLAGLTLTMPLLPGLYARASGFYQYGLSNMLNSSVGGVGTSYSVYTRNINILAGFMIGI